jgi:hypothetical protein
MSGCNSADVAVDLSNDEVGREITNQVAVDVIERLARADSAVYFGVYGATGNGDIKGGLGAGWKRANPRRIVTLMRTADQTIAGAKSAHNLRAAGEKRDDAHWPSF